MRIKVNPKERSLTGHKLKRGGEGAETHVKGMHNSAPLLQLQLLAVRSPSLSSDGFHLGRQTRHFA